MNIASCSTHTRMSETLDAQRAEALFERDPSALDDALSELLTRGADAAPLLLQIERDSGHREVRKQVRRALHRLESQGIPVPRDQRQGHRAALPRVARREAEGWLTPIDVLGRRGVLLLLPRRGRATLYEIGISDEQGLLGVTPRDGPAREARRLLRSLRDRHKGALLSVPVGEALVLMARAVTLSGSDELLPAELAELLREGSQRTPGERLREEWHAAPLEAAQAEERIGELVASGRLPVWPVLGDAVRELARATTEAEQSPLVLSEAQQIERRRELEVTRAPAIFSAATRERLAGRCEEAAVFLQAGHDTEAVAAVLALAERLRSDAEPLELGYLRKSLELSLEIAGRDQNEQEGGAQTEPG
jgi:hypothetical protein